MAQIECKFDWLVYWRDGRIHTTGVAGRGAPQGYRTARTELAGALSPHAIDTVLAAYRKEGARLAATAEAVELVERALRGEVFTPKMSLPSAESRIGEPVGAGSRRTRPEA